MNLRGGGPPLAEGSRGLGAISRLGRWRVRFRPPLVRQHDASDCGPAALLSVLQFWGGDESFPAVRELSSTDARGSTLLGLRGAAEALGLEARGAQGGFEELRREAMPCIAHLVEEGGRAHFVAINRITRDRVWIGDPARGHRSCSRDEFETLWKTRCVLLLSPTARIRRRPPVGWVSWLFGYVQRESVWLVQSIFLGALATTLGLLTAVFVQWLIDRFIPERNVSMILATGLALLVVLLARGAAHYLRQRFVVRLNRRVSSHVNEDFLTHLYRLPLRFFESRATGDITARISDGIRIQQAVVQICGTAVIDGLVVVGSIVCLFLVAPPLGVMALGTIPLYTAIVARGTKSIRTEQTVALSAYGTLEAGYIDSIRGISDVLAFGVSNSFARANAALHRLFNESVERLGGILAGLTLFSELAGGTLAVAMLTWGALLVVAEDLLLGQLIAGYSLLGGLIPSADRLVQACAGFQETAVSASRFRDLFLTPLHTQKAASAVTPPIRQGLKLDSLALTWPTGERQLYGLDFSLPVGTVTGLWGASGAGKTTLVRVLNRTCSPSTGRILLDGMPVEGFGLDDYRRNVAVFPADTHLFNGSLAHNVLLGRISGSPGSVCSGT